MKKRFIYIIACLLTVSFVLEGCDNDKQKENQITTTAAAVTTEAEEPLPYPFLLNDVEIKSKPERIVCLSPTIAEIIFEMGYVDTIIGRSSYCDYPTTIASAKDVGSTANPDINAIIELKPDMVISSTPIASKDIFEMEQQGITTLVIPSPTALDGFSSIYTSLGLVFEGMFTGKEKGEQVYSEISKVLGNKDSFSVGKFVYITENLTAAGGNTFESAVLSCFGTNMAKESEGYSFDITSLLENQPDILLVNKKYTKDVLLQNETLSQLDAVKNDKIIFIDNFFFERPTRRIIDMIDNLIDEYRQMTGSL